MPDRPAIPVSYAVPTERTSPKFAKAFAAGCGGAVDPRDELRPGAVALFGSAHRWALLQQAIAEGRTWYYGDHGYFGRFRFYRITRNAYQHDGRGAAAKTRFASFRLTVQPWRTMGRHVLVCPNSPGYFALHQVEDWTAGTLAALAQATDRPVRIRWKGDPRPIAEDLREAWAVVTFSSASAIEALLAGVPVCTTAPWASTARMGLTDVRDIEQPIYPDDRAAFFAKLAEQQWTLPEIAAGLAWRALQRG